jgi:hypothetical protein
MISVFPSMLTAPDEPSGKSSEHAVRDDKSTKAKIKVLSNFVFVVLIFITLLSLCLEYIKIKHHKRYKSINFRTI